MASEIGSSGPNEMETSPEMLKNTPSNIRRLANEIELCEGRQKYLAHTRSPSDGGDVRWYFCKVPLGINELSASFPRTEIVGKGDYFRFGMRDSLAIEATFLQREEELLSSWWREFAECSEGPKEQISSASQPNESSPSATHEACRSFANEEERVGVPVKGGLYEVDLLKRHCFPVYWYGENRRVLRGHWFALKGGLDWLPLREDISEQLEYAYRGKVWRRRTFQPSGLFAARVDLQGSVPELHVLFTGEDDTWEAWMSVQSSGFRGVVGFSRNSIKLRRGYAPPLSQKPTQDELRQQKEEEIDDYCSQVPVRHVVFMIHGIGQRLEKSNLVDDVGDFRHVTANIAERHLTSYQRGMQRILYIPCQWRKGLTFSGESAIETITLDGVRGLRRTLSATVHDVLYYMSPIFCQEIIDSVSNQLNRLYLKFLKRNPGYDGKISIYGHSLGSVLTYDILCHQEKLSSPFPMEWMFKEHKGVEALSSDNVLPGNPKSISVQKNENSGIGSADTPDPVEDHSETNHLSPPAPSESDESTSTNVGCSHADESMLAVENQDYHASNSFNFEASTSDLCGSNSEKSELPSNKKNSINISGDDKDDVVESLRKEIDILKEKMRDYDAKYADKAVQPRPDNSVKIHVPQIKYTKLLFKVDTFYAVGSPLGVFLSMRSVRVGIGKGKEYWNEESIHEEMPACKQMFNIFHPCDPVAYRIEPLVCKEFIRKHPVIIPYHRGGKRLYVGFQEFTEGWAARSQALKGHLISARDKVLTICESKSGNKSSEIAESIKDEEERSYGSLMMERVTGTINGRIDYSLQDKTFRHPYLSVLSAHTNYWRDPDTALFILNHLYRDIPEEPSRSRAAPMKKAPAVQGDGLILEELMRKNFRLPSPIWCLQRTSPSEPKKL